MWNSTRPPFHKGDEIANESEDEGPHHLSEQLMMNDSNILGNDNSHLQVGKLLQILSHNTLPMCCLRDICFNLVYLQVIRLLFLALNGNCLAFVPFDKVQ